MYSMSSFWVFLGFFVPRSMTACPGLEGKGPLVRAPADSLAPRKRALATARLTAARMEPSSSSGDEAKPQTPSLNARDETPAWAPRELPTTSPLRRLILIDLFSCTRSSAYSSNSGAWRPMFSYLMNPPCSPATAGAYFLRYCDRRRGASARLHPYALYSSP